MSTLVLLQSRSRRPVVRKPQATLPDHPAALDESLQEDDAELKVDHKRLRNAQEEAGQVLHANGSHLRGDTMHRLLGMLQDVHVDCNPVEMLYLGM